MTKHGFVTAAVLTKRQELDGTVPSLQSRNIAQSSFVQKIKDACGAAPFHPVSASGENRRNSGHVPRSPRMPASPRPEPIIPFAKRPTFLRRIILGAISSHDKNMEGRDRVHLSVQRKLDTARIREHITVGLQTGRHSFNAAIPFDDVQWLDTVVVWLEERLCVHAMQDVPTRVISPERKLRTAERQRRPSYSRQSNTTADKSFSQQISLEVSPRPPSGRRPSLRRPSRVLSGALIGFRLKYRMRKFVFVVMFVSIARRRSRHFNASVLVEFLKDAKFSAKSLMMVFAKFKARLIRAQRFFRWYQACRRARLQGLIRMWEQAVDEILYAKNREEEAERRKSDWERSVGRLLQRMQNDLDGSRTRRSLPDGLTVRSKAGYRRRRRRSSILAELEATLAGTGSEGLTLESFASTGLVTNKSAVLLTGRPCSSCKDRDEEMPEHQQSGVNLHAASSVTSLTSESRRNSRRRSSLGGCRRRRSSVSSVNTAGYPDGIQPSVSDDVPAPIVTDWAQRRLDILSKYIQQKYREFVTTNVRAWRISRRHSHPTLTVDDIKALLVVHSTKEADSMIETQFRKAAASRYHLPEFHFFTKFVSKAEMKTMVGSFLEEQQKEADFVNGVTTD